MSFSIRDTKGKPVARRSVVLDCSNDDPIVEQSHKADVDINNIVKRHGRSLMQDYVKRLQSEEFRFDDVTGNDFQEAMIKVRKAQATFDRLPSDIRAKFGHNPAEFMDFVQNPDNGSQLVEMGLATARPVDAPVEVRVIPDAPSPSDTSDNPS